MIIEGPYGYVIIFIPFSVRGGGGKGEGVRIKSLTLLMTIMQIAIKSACL